MQETQTISEERPQRAAQVVPIEPSLRKRYWILFLGIIMLPLLAAIFFLAFNSLDGNNLLAGYMLLWQHSLPGTAPLPYLAYSATYVLPFGRWKTLDKRRQQAARYNMTVGAWARAVARPQPDAPALPDAFAISTEHSWPATIFFALISILILYVISVVAYSGWQATSQIIQQGVPVILVILNNCLNFALLLCGAAGAFISLVFAPRQQLIATGDGLTCHQGYRTSFIPWQQAQLFAIIAQANTNKKRPVALFYELASQDTSIRWPSTNTSVKRNRAIIPANISLFHMCSRYSGSTIAPFTEQVLFLNIIIAERTGLPLYDLR